MLDVEAWLPRGRWEWIDPATDQLHAVWIEAGIDPQTHEIVRWRVSAQTSRRGQVHVSQPAVFDADGDYSGTGVSSARDAARHAAGRYRDENGGGDVGPL